MKKYSFNKISLLISLYLLIIILITSTFVLETREFSGWENVRIIILLLFIPYITKFTIHLLVVPWYRLVTDKRTNTSNYNPYVSFILPAWNEEVGIINTIQSVLKSKYRKFELIIVNDGSEDRTGELVTKFINKYEGDISIKYFKKRNGGKSSALNLGIKNSKGEIIITSDADCALDDLAINNIIKHFSSQDVMATAGNVRVGNSNSIIGMIQKLEYFNGFYFKRADSLLNSVYIVGGAAAAYRREVFDKLGYFDEEIITEDIEYSTRILNSGYKIRYATDAIFYTEAPSDIGSLIKQRLRWKYGRLKTFAKYNSLFFKFNGSHSKFLSFLSLPVALFGEVLLFLEVILLPLYILFSFLMGDFFPLAFSVLVFSLILLLQIITDYKKEENKGLIILAPIGLMLIYFTHFIEYIALMKTIARVYKNKKVVWQKWERVGVFNS